MPLDNMNYTLRGKTYQFTEQENALFDGLVIDSTDEWGKTRYDNLKRNIKKKYLKDQSDRCGYCRVYVEPDGLYEPLEHIVAKTSKPNWMFHPKNLSVACNPCNNLKHTETTLTEEYDEGDEYPAEDRFFSVFHPHFDEWNDHLEIQDDIFIRAKDQKGENTVSAYKLTRYQIPVNLSREQKLGPEESARKIAYRLTQVQAGSNEYKRLMEALEHFKERI